MEENLIKKKLMTLQQESKEVQADWAIIHQRLVELNLSGKDEQENSNLETPEYQVETNNSVRLWLSDTIGTLDLSLLPPTTFLIYTPKQPPSSWNVAVHCSVFTQVFLEVSLLWDTELASFETLLPLANASFNSALICSPLQGDRWITCHILACPHDRWNAMQRFEWDLGP